MYHFFGGFPGGSEVKASASNAGDPGSIPGSGRSPGEGNGNPLQCSYLENPMVGEAWWATVHRVAKSRPRLSDLASLGCAYTTYYGHTICMYIHGIYICYAFPRVLWKNLKELFGQPSICIRRRQWHPLQDSCLENPMDGGAWWAAVHGVAEGRT